MQAWEKTYKANRHMVAWPWSDIISDVMNLKPTKDTKVLEIGCGPGANIPFFIDIEVDYYTIDGSETAVKRVNSLFPSLKNKVACCDFTKEIPFNTTFDLIIDRVALTHNDTESIKNFLSIIKTKLNKNGKYIGVDWFSKEHSYAKSSDSTINIDSHTMDNCIGFFEDLGPVHFSDQDHILDLFKDFHCLKMEHKINYQKIPSEKKFATWNFIFEKK
jgi:SAM-dependent methyltransferase